MQSFFLAIGNIDIRILSIDSYQKFRKFQKFQNMPKMENAICESDRLKANELKILANMCLEKQCLSILGVKQSYMLIYYVETCKRKYVI